jgi:hypothetical protein
MIGEPGAITWDQATTAQRIASMRGVTAHIKNPFMTPKQAHDAWVEDRRNEGWVWGIDKNDALKTHPWLVPWNQLPPIQRVKDSLFSSTVRAFLEHGQIDIWADD